MGRKKKNTGGAGVIDTDQLESAIDEKLDEQAEGEQGEGMASDNGEDSSREGQAADSAGDEPAAADGPAQEKNPPASESDSDKTAAGASRAGKNPVQAIRDQLGDSQKQLADAARWHNEVALLLYDAELRVKRMRKDREEAIERLSCLKNEVDYLTTREKELRDAPAPLFEKEIADEWREFDLSAASLQGAMAQSLRDAGVNTLGEIADWTKDGTRKLSDIDGIGPETSGKIADLVGKFFDANPRYKWDGGDGEDSEPSKVPSLVRITSTISGEDYELTHGDEYDVINYEDGAATVDLGNGTSVDVPFGSYAVVVWREKKAEMEAEG